jgi:hypothetical protein
MGAQKEPSKNYIWCRCSHVSKLSSTYAIRNAGNKILLLICYLSLKLLPFLIPNKKNSDIGDQMIKKSLQQPPYPLPSFSPWTKTPSPSPL